LEGVIGGLGPRTGMSCFSTRWSPKGCSTGSWTPPSTCTWKARATGRDGGRARPPSLPREVRQS